MSGVISRMVQVHPHRRNAAGEREFLVLRRSDDEELYPGLWQMVTGSIEEGETAVEAARRELREETGAETDALVVVPYVATFYFPADDSIHHVPVFAAEIPTGFQIRLSAEHSECAWLPFDDAWRRLVFPGHREGLRILRAYVLRD